MSKRKSREFNFVLQFPEADIPKWAKAYSYKTDDDKERRLLTEIGPRVRKLGYFDREDFLLACDWKSTRPAHLYTQNADDDIRKVTALRLSTANERLRVCLLAALRGVDYPIASVLLHFGSHEPYPIIDFRAFEAAGVPRQDYYTFETWWNYVECCRKLANASALDMRTVDRAMWQWSKDRSR